jgi:hypothetical protein
MLFFQKIMNTPNHYHRIFLSVVFTLILQSCVAYIMVANTLTDTAQTRSLEYSDYLMVSGGYAFGDATINRVGLMYSMHYGHIFSPLIDAECSVQITGQDGGSNGFTQVLSSTALDITCFFKPLFNNQLRIGAGISVRQRQFYYSTPNYAGIVYEVEDRYINDVSVGGNAKIDYMLFTSSSIELGTRLSGQLFILPVGGSYRFKNNPSNLKEINFSLVPMIVSLSAFFRVNF